MTSGGYATGNEVYPAAPVTPPAAPSTPIPISQTVTPTPAGVATNQVQPETPPSVPFTRVPEDPENSWHILPADAFPGEGDVVLGVSGGVMVRIPISGIGDLLTSPNSSKLGDALSQLNAAVASAKADFDKRFAEARIVSDVINLSSGQAIGTRDILGSTFGGVPTFDNFNAFFGAISSGNIANAAKAANAKAIAGIEELKVTYAGLNDAIAGTHQIIAAANDSGTAAAIDEEKIARITADDALAVETQTLSATIGGNFSTVNTISAAYANINGTLAATYGVTLDVNGYVSGFQALNGGSAGSAFNVRADAFNLVMPNFSATPVLRVSNVNGTPTLAFDGRIIADGTVLNGSVANENITTVRGTSFGPASAGNGLSFISPGLVLVTWTFNVGIAGPYIVTVISPGFSTFSGGADVNITIDNSQIASFHYQGDASGQSTVPATPINLTWSGNLAAGNHTLKIVTGNSSGATLLIIAGGSVALIVGSK